MLKVQFSDKPVTATPINIWDHVGHTTSSGKSHYRVFLEGEDNKALAIRALSQEILDKPPGFDFLHFIGFRKRVVLHVQADGHVDGKPVNKIGYVALNAESLRKRLGIEASAFYKAIKKDEKELNTYIQNAIDKKCAESLNRLGEAYLFGKNGKEQDLEKAFQLFQRASNGGEPLGYGHLAFCYSKGKGVAQDTHKAKKALEDMFKNIQNVKVNPSLRSGYFYQFAKLGIKELESFIDEEKDPYNKKNFQITLAEEYLTGNKNLPADEKKGFELAQIVANQNHPLGFEGLALCYSLGKSVKKNSNQALDCIKKMVEAYRLEYLPFGPPLGYTDAAARSLIKLSNLDVLEVTQFCEENPDFYIYIAREFFNQFISPIEKDESKEKKGFEMLQKAAAHNLPEAYLCIAHCYQNGKGVKKDGLKALEALDKMRQYVQNPLEAEELLKTLASPHLEIYDSYIPFI